MTFSLSRAIALAFALPLSCGLGGCNTSVNSTIASDVSASLPSICSLGASAHAAFATIATTGKLTNAAVNREAAAFAGLQSLCANPPSDVGSAVTEAASIYATIVGALNAAHSAK